jgi:autotransporter-associated beta strand protein
MRALMQHVLENDMSLWNALGSGNWGTSANWIGGVPNGAGAIADFTALASGAINHLIDLQALTRTVHELDMRSSTIERFTITNGALVFGTGVGNAELNVDSTGAGIALSSVVASNVSVFFNVNTNIDVAGGSTLDILGQLYGSGQIFKYGAGTMRLGNVVSTRTGVTDIRGGALEVVNGTALGHGNILIGDGTLRATADITLSNNITVISGADATIEAASGTTTTLTGALGMAQGATGSLHFGSGANAGMIVYAAQSPGLIDKAGQIFIDGGTLRDDSPFFTGMSGSLSGITIATGAVLDIYGDDVTINHLSGDGAITNEGVINSISTLTLIENGVGSFSGDFVQGTYNVIIRKQGVGTLALSGSSNMQGSFNVQEGTLRTDASGIFGSESAPMSLIVNAGAIVDLNGFDQAVETLVGDGQILGNGAGIVVLTIGQGTQGNGGTAFFGTLSNGTGVLGELAIVKTGLDGLGLHGTNDYTGSTQIISSTLALGGSGSIANSRFVDVGIDGVFDVSNVSGAGATVRALHNVGSVDVASKVLQLSHQDVDLKAAFLGSALVEGVTVNMEQFLANFSAATAKFTTWTDTIDSITINGNALDNIITGTTHADKIRGGLGKDTLNGGLGSDTADYSDKTGAVVVTLNGATAANVTIGGVIEDNVKNIENLVGGKAADKLTGDALANMLNGGVDVLADTLTGKAGNDIYIINNATDNIVELIGEGTADRAKVAVSFTLGVGDNIEFLETVDATATTVINLKGNEIAQTITGNAANNTITGGGGLDHMVGGDGSDIYFADLASDVVIETNNSFAVGGNDLVNFTGSAGTFTLGLNVERLTLQGVAAINGIGNALSNILTGNSAANTLSGLGGYDIINGGGGLDHMTGGDGSDTYYADLATDVVTESNAVLATGGDDLVYFTGATGTFKLGANVERLTLQGAAAINGTGNALANTIIGNGAANVLNGGLGIDTLTGGLGNDTFRFDTLLAANIDNITDFNVAADTMQLENAIFTGLTAGAVITAAQFHDITAAAQDADDKILYNHTTGNLTFDSNGLAAGGQTVFAHVTANTALTNLDFFVT